MKKDNKKINKIVKIANKVLFFTFYIVVLLILDAICLIGFKPSNPNYLTIISLDIGLGLFFSFLMMIKNKIAKTILFIIISLLFIFYSLFEFVEIAINKIVGNIFTFSTISFNIKNVLIEYADEVGNGVSSNAFQLVILFVLVILFLFLSKLIYFGGFENIFNKSANKKNTSVTSQKRAKSKNTSKKDFFNIKTTIITFATSIIFIITSIVSINKNVFDFESNMNVNGLKVAVAMDAMQIDSTNIIDVANKVHDDTVGADIIRPIDDNLASDSIATIMNKPYYYNTEEYNVINFDFDEIISKEDRPNYNAISEFIKKRTPTKKNEYTGLFKGKNLIMICAEAWNSRVVDKDLFPTMYRLMNNGFKFNNFYQPHGSSSTSAGEYAFMTGMIPVDNDKSFVDSVNNNMGFAISMKLKEEDYYTYSFHNGRSTFYGRDETHESLMGFDRFMADDTGLNALARQQMTDDTNLIKIMYDLSKKEKPFLTYAMTYNGHKPYVNINNKKTLEFYDKVNAKYKKRFTEPVKYYIAKNMYLESGLKYLIDKLEEDGLINDTVICLVPDHYPYGLINVSEEKNDNVDYLLDLYKDAKGSVGKTYRDRTDIILWSGCLENEKKSYVKEIDKVTNTIDLTPTLLNLFGLEFDSRLYPGRDVFSDFKGRAIYQNGMFIDSELKTVNIPSSITETDDPDVFEVYNLINYCRFNMRNDYYGYLVGKKSTKQKTCYLTFDGGPTKNTKEILKILNEKGVKATFFVTGAMDLPIVFDIARGNHTVGVQSYFKNYKQIYSNDAAFQIDFCQVYQKVSEIYKDEKIRYMRFYGGSDNTIGEKENPGGMDRAIEFVYSMGVNYVDWNVDSGDSKPIEKDEIINNVLKNAESLDDICVLLHDDKDNMETVKALPELIDRLRSKGYRFKKIVEYSKLFHRK